MRVAIIGSGVAGLTAGAALARAGHQVTILDLAVDAAYRPGKDPRMSIVDRFFPSGFQDDSCHNPSLFFNGVKYNIAPIFCQRAKASKPNANR